MKKNQKIQKQVKVKFLKATMAEKRPMKVGDIRTLDEKEARFLIGIGKAIEVKDEAPAAGDQLPPPALDESPEEEMDEDPMGSGNDQFGDEELPEGAEVSDELNFDDLSEEQQQEVLEQAGDEEQPLVPGDAPAPEQPAQQGKKKNKKEKNK